MPLPQSFNQQPPPPLPTHLLQYSHPLPPPPPYLSSLRLITRWSCVAAGWPQQLHFSFSISLYPIRSLLSPTPNPPMFIFSAPPHAFVHSIEPSKALSLIDPSTACALSHAMHHLHKVNNPCTLLSSLSSAARCQPQHHLPFLSLEPDSSGAMSRSRPCNLPQQQQVLAQ